ncbi:hypothetical protein ANCDUO_08248 [Ancylostoma duodenale]|uniref:ATP-dependent DNA helicase n=1 Tax=Ancylostoma duodenale TaxID=51022 RepID=A0A0C2CWY0_9BILA|nr:hypothetical protein ANCDUO_08248 [Ancylostoma duodenale]
MPDRSQGFTHTTSSGEVVGNEWVVPYNWYLSTIKYLNKYVYKGPDRARLIMQSRSDTDSIEYDEIRSHLDTRYSCPPQAAWNMFGFALHDRSHSVVRLPVHLPGQQEIFFQEGHEADAVNAAAERNTQLTGWFRLNQVNQDARRFLYREIPEHFRKGERFYLRVMLLYTTGATGFEYLRNVNGTQYSTFREAAIAAGYLQDDEEYRRCLEDGRRMSMRSQMRALFAYILSLCKINNGHSLWNDLKDSMMEDFLRGGLLPNVVEAVAYTEIKEIALGCGVDVTTIIPPPMCTTAVVDNDVVDVDAYREEGSRLYQTLNAQQKHIVDAVITNTEKCVFIDGPGGSGKTYTYNVLYKLLNSLMSVQSRQARDLQSTDCIIWDEAPMAPKFALEALDQLLRDIAQSDQPFGGKTMILGDFRQIPPVVPQASRMEVVNITIKNCSLWPYFHQFSLTENMRAQSAGAQWCNFLIQLGNGEMQDPSGNVEIPAELLSKGDIIDDVFGDITTIEDINTAVDRAILIPKIFDSLEINHKVLRRLPGEEKLCRSTDEVECETEADATDFPLEFLNSLTPPGYPPNELF